MIFNGLDTSSYGQEDVLFFIRIKGKEHFFDKIYGNETIKNLFGHINFHQTISEYKNADHYIDINQFDLSDFNSDDYAMYYLWIHNDLPSIIWRCRGLRSLPFQEAKNLVLKACKFFNEFFKKNNNYKLLVIHIIDNYIIDIMCKVAECHKIKISCITEWFIRGYYRHSMYGELHPFREVGDAEIQMVINHCNNKKAFWLDALNRKKMRKYAIYLFVRHWILYFSRYVFMYKLIGNPAYEYKFANISNRLKIKHFFINRFFNSINEEYILDNKENLILLPLHVFPEANVDYWINDSQHADYYSSLFEVMSFFRSKGKILVIKEHPGFIYQRDPNFYHQIKQFENVLLIDPFSESAPLLDLIPTVLVWHGTSGIEALIKGKKVIAFDHNYYTEGYVPAYQNFESARSLNSKQQVSFVRRLLSGVQQVW